MMSVIVRKESTRSCNFYNVACFAVHFFVVVVVVNLMHVLVLCVPYVGPKGKKEAHIHKRGGGGGGRHEERNTEINRETGIQREREGVRDTKIVEKGDR